MTLTVLLDATIERIFSIFPLLSPIPRELIQHSDFPLTKILAAHIAGCLKEVGTAWDSVVIAIPNELDEFGQDGLPGGLR